MNLTQALSALRRKAFSPRLKIDGGIPTRRLGTEYGGWDFVDLPELHGSTIISCGLGEDASFDVAFAAAYGAKVVLVDPTPRAIAHFQAIKARLGKPATREFSAGGNQPAEAYDLSALNADSLQLVERAVWTEETTLKFYAPENPSFVSHSITNYFHGYSTATPFIEVKSVTMETLMRGLPEIPLIKMDIEGAETPVLLDMMKKGITPRQILVELDEITVYSWRSMARIKRLDRELRRQGYRIVRFYPAANYLYARV